MAIKSQGDRSGQPNDGQVGREHRQTIRRRKGPSDEPPPGGGGWRRGRRWWRGRRWGWRRGRTRCRLGCGGGRGRGRCYRRSCGGRCRSHGGRDHLQWFAISREALGRDRDRPRPGQVIVIVKFSPVRPVRDGYRSHRAPAGHRGEFLIRPGRGRAQVHGRGSRGYGIAEYVQPLDHVPGRPLANRDGRGVFDYPELAGGVEPAEPIPAALPCGGGALPIVYAAGGEPEPIPNPIPNGVWEPRQLHPFVPRNAVGVEPISRVLQDVVTPQSEYIIRILGDPSPDPE